MMNRDADAIRLLRDFPQPRALHEPWFPNPNDESRNPKEYRNPNDQTTDRTPERLRHSGFGFLSSFVVRHSLFNRFKVPMHGCKADEALHEPERAPGIQ